MLFLLNQSIFKARLPSLAISRNKSFSESSTPQDSFFLRLSAYLCCPCAFHPFPIFRFLGFLSERICSKLDFTQFLIVCLKSYNFYQYEYGVIVAIFERAI